jgi:dihydroxyacetone kinase
LEALWLAPADVASFTRGQAVAPGGRRRSLDAAAETPTSVEPGAPASQQAAAALAQAFENVKTTLAEAEAGLGAIDTVAGDGDHGVGMATGAAAAAEAARTALAHGAGAGTLLRLAGAAWSKHAGGTSGALWGAGLEAAAPVIADAAAPDSAAVARAAAAFSDAIISRGGAAPGDKTMVDAVVPFAETLAAEVGAGSELAAAWLAASVAADRAARSTSAFASRRGRSKLHGGRSIGTPDPGATSFALIVTSLADGFRR